MTKKRQAAKPDAPKPWSWAEEERAQNAVVERLCAELGIDRDELFRRAKERLRYACQQMMKERPKSQPSGQQAERGDA
jgi:hypothetical protein